MATAEERIRGLEYEVQALKRDNESLRKAADQLWGDIYGENPNDKNSIVYQLQTLNRDRALAAWFVSISVGIGATILAGVALWIMTGK